MYLGYAHIQAQSGKSPKTMGQAMQNAGLLFQGIARTTRNPKLRALGDALVSDGRSVPANRSLTPSEIAAATNLLAGAIMLVQAEID